MRYEVRINEGEQDEEDVSTGGVRGRVYMPNEMYVGVQYTPNIRLRWNLP